MHNLRPTSDSTYLCLTQPAMVVLAGLSLCVLPIASTRKPLQTAWAFAWSEDASEGEKVTLIFISKEQIFKRHAHSMTWLEEKIWLIWQHNEVVKPDETVQTWTNSVMWAAKELPLQLSVSYEDKCSFLLSFLQFLFWSKILVALFLPPHNFFAPFTYELSTLPETA